MIQFKRKKLYAAIALATMSNFAAAFSSLIYDYALYENDIAPQLTSRQVALGNTATTIDVSSTYSTYSPVNLSSYGQVWDLGATRALGANQVAAYTAYVRNGGSLFVMGENGGYGPARNASIATMVSSIVGTTVTIDSTARNILATVDPQFRTANNSSQVYLPYEGKVTVLGGGVCIISSCGAVAWSLSTLTGGVYRGTIISVLDVNFLQPGFQSNTTNSSNQGYLTQDFTDNLIAYLVQQAQIAAGGGSVLSSAVAQSNSPAFGAARVIDANSGLASLFSGLSTDQSRSAAASQTLPLLTGSSVIAAQSVQRDISRIIQARLANNLGMSTGDNFDGDKNVWMKPFGSLADQNDRNGVAGYNANTFGLAIGADAALTRALRIGGAFAYAKSDINGESSVAPQSALVDVYQLIGYGSYSLDDRTEINFQAGLGQNQNKGRRLIALTSSIATSSFSSETVNVGFGIGRTYQLSAATSVTPSVRLDYSWIKDKGYSEAGAGVLNLNVDGRETDALIVGADGKVAHQLNDQTTLIANLGVGYDTINKQASITSAFAGAPGAAFVTYGIDPSPWLARGGVGGVYKTKSGLEITARYDAEYRESFLNQTASVKARWAF